MAKKQQKLSFRSWFRRMFRQPPAGFYSRPCMYWAGGILEIEHFRKIRSYDEEKLCLEFGQNVLTIYGDHLRDVYKRQERQKTDSPSPLLIQQATLKAR